MRALTSASPLRALFLLHLSPRPTLTMNPYSSSSSYRSSVAAFASPHQPRGRGGGRCSDGRGGGGGDGGERIDALGRLLVWVARKPPGFAFIDFDDKRDAQDSIRDTDGKNGWRVELSRNASSGRGRRDRSGGSESKFYECGESGHFARECCLRIGSGGLGSGRRRSRSRSRSRSPRYRRSPSYSRRASPWTTSMLVRVQTTVGFQPRWSH